MYTNSTLKSLLDQAAALSGKGVKSIKLKHVEEHQTRRLDLLLYEKSTETLPVEMRVLNTLQDVKVTHNTILMIEEKSEEEIAGENEGSIEQKAVESIDESDNMRTVISNIEGFEEFQRFQVDITRDLNYLVDFLKDKFELDGERRLKDHAAKRFFFKEEMENKLKSYETFVEGGSRIEIGLGRPTTMAEITVNVIIHKKPESF